MKKLILLLIIMFSLYSCESKKQEYIANNNIEKDIQKLFTENKQVSDSISKIFEKKNNNTVLKVFFNRKEDFLRLTFYQIFYLDEIKCNPHYIIYSKDKTFLCYDGIEILNRKNTKIDSIKKILIDKKIIFQENNNDLDAIAKRYLQFDFYSWNKIMFNERNRYDFYGSNNNIKFQVP